MTPSNPSPRQHIGQVSIYAHHGAWYLYHRDRGKPVRRRVGASLEQAECEASLLNARLIADSAALPLAEIASEIIGVGVPAAVKVTGVDEPSLPIKDLRQRFLDHHEHVLHSAVSTVRRYRAATQHLMDFARRAGIDNTADVAVADFVRDLRTIEVSSNGHAHTARRRLKDKGIKYILETCRSMYHFGHKHGLLPAARSNPFTDFGLGKLRIRDAKPIFVFTAHDEQSFFEAADPWSYAIHMALAKTGMRPGELVHLLIEDLDLDDGWLHVRGKVELGWTLKAGGERRIPLIAELIDLLRGVIATRTTGPVFLRTRLSQTNLPKLVGDRNALTRVAQRRLAEAQKPLDRHGQARVLRTVWQDAGAVRVDRVRSTFVRVAKSAGLTATCPKSWRHTFATLLQEANVDLLVRQETLGHKPTVPGAGILGMTGTYTHTQPDFQKREIERAMRRRPVTSVTRCVTMQLGQTKMCSPPV
jgi:integrase